MYEYKHIAAARLSRMTAEDRAIVHRQESTVSAMVNADEGDAQLMRAAVRERRDWFNRGRRLVTTSAWMLAHQGFSDPLNPGMDSIPASEL